MSRLSKVGAAALAAFGWTSGSSVTATYLVVAGGGGGSGGNGGSPAAGAGGGGAGGYRTGTASLNPTLSYTITVGAGGSAGVDNGLGTSGSDSIFSTITSTGGGRGGSTGGVNGLDGGSGGGGQGKNSGAGGAGNTPSTSPSQGSNGGAGGTSVGGGGGGGGGATATGTTATSASGGAGGAGTASSITGSSVTYGGGGGGGNQSSGSGGTGGSGGGGTGGTNAVGTAGTANLGGGGGGGGVTGSNSGFAGGAGGSGIVIISYTSATQLFGGGTVTQSGGNFIHTFTSSGALSPLSSVSASYLIVAGGGGGSGGGGGAGGLLSGSGLTLDSNSIYTVTVGSGGAGGQSTSTTANGIQGTNSLFSAVSTSAVGGGGGSQQSGNVVTTNKNGGSGGGGGYDQPAGTGTSGQGFAGGAAVIGGERGNGGGGGAGAVGADGTTSAGGVGGVGVASSISGSSTYYAGGGGGGNYSSSANNVANGAGGNGGGGNAATTNKTAGRNGTANLGGGGGGAQDGPNPPANVLGGNGGSGIVIISYAGATQLMAGGTVIISGGNVIHTFTSSGYLAPIKYVGNSLRFRSSASAYLNRTPTTASNRKTWTWSGWVKRGTLTTDQRLFEGYVDTSNWTTISFESVDRIQIAHRVGGTSTYNLVTTAVYRDPAAWYHIVVAFDTTQATSADRVKLYINGTQVTVFTTNTIGSQNVDTFVDATNVHNIGRYGAASQYFDGYMTEINFIDGQALTPSSFGTFNSYGVWQPITYGGSYGTNGFYLTFGNNTSTTTLGYDTSPQGNNWTTNNISVTAGATYDSMTDVPTLTSASAANWCTGNPLDGTAGTNIPTYSNGNLTISFGNANYGLMGTMYSGTGGGKFYFEVSGTNVGGIYNTIVFIGFKDRSGNYWGYQVYNGDISSNLGSPAYTGTGYGSGGWPTIGIAVDATNGKIWFRNNSGWYGSGDPASGANPAFTNVTAQVSPYFNGGGGGYSGTLNFNFGQQPFTYTPPSGFVALNTYNLSTPTIPNGAAYMAATLYTGTGATQSIVNAVNGVSFQPDWVWVKNRATTDFHILQDSVRGTGKELFSNSTGAEESYANSLTSFNSNGFTLGSRLPPNNTGSAYVGWQWNAGGSTVTNTSGTISAQVRANPTAGFSVVTYTGIGAARTVGHGLGVAPSFIIFKNRSAVSTWIVYSTAWSNPGTNYLQLNSTLALQNDGIGQFFNSTAATSSVFSIGTSNDVGGNGSNYVAYCFAAVAGYSAFGKYTGNGSADGPFVYLGFRPRFVMIKGSSNADRAWVMLDTSRNTANVMNLNLYANSSVAEATDTRADGLSNGFKVRGTGTWVNNNASTYIYMAFAENPFKYANSR